MFVRAQVYAYVSTCLCVTKCKRTLKALSFGRRLPTLVKCPWSLAGDGSLDRLVKERLKTALIFLKPLSQVSFEIFKTLLLRGDLRNAEVNICTSGWSTGRHTYTDMHTRTRAHTFMHLTTSKNTCLTHVHKRRSSFSTHKTHTYTS